MAGAARHLALAHRRVGDRGLGLANLQPVTRGTQLRLSRLDKLPFRRLRAVYAVAGGARQIAAIVRAAFPCRVIAAVVAREARRARLRGGRGRSEALDQFGIPALGVRLAGPVAAFAAVGRGRGARIPGLRVRRTFERGLVVLVAGDAGLLTDVLAGRRRGLSLWLRAWRRRGRS